MIEVAGQRGQGGRGSAIGHHGEGTRHGGMLQVENEGGSIVRRQLLIPRRGQKCSRLRWKKCIFFSVQGQSCLDSQPTCWAQDSVFQQQNVAGPAQDPAQTAVTKFTSISYLIRSDKSLCPPGTPAATHSHATQTHPNKHQFHSQHSYPTTDSTMHRPSSFPLPRARGLC